MKLPTTPSFRLDGRRALVAGASSGIGLGCAVALAEAGAHVVMAARGKERLEEAVTAAREAGHSVEALQLDITETDAMRDALAPLGPLDVVVNSAGVARHSPALESTPEDYDATVAANLRGANLSEVNLRGADLSNANLLEASLEGAHLFKAKGFRLDGNYTRDIKLSPRAKDPWSVLRRSFRLQRWCRGIPGRHALAHESRADRDSRGRGRDVDVRQCDLPS